eukprot:SAG31_NODE_13061_length_895_cov_5.406439_1_plen_40_part_10
MSQRDSIDIHELYNEIMEHSLRLHSHIITVHVEFLMQVLI